MRPPRLIISRAHADPQIGAVRHDTTLPCVNDVSADEVRQLSQQLPKPGILLKQGVNVVGVFVTPKCRFIPSKGIFLK
jgi:hypothetical protein